MLDNINEILRIYLGTDTSGGYQPVGCEDRLRDAYPSNPDMVLARIAHYLDFEFSPAYQFPDLVQARDAFESAIKTTFPELEPVVARALANRYAYNWR
jgi:hypothetical protein